MTIRPYTALHPSLHPYPYMQTPYIQTPCMQTQLLDKLQTASRQGVHVANSLRQEVTSFSLYPLYPLYPLHPLHPLYPYMLRQADANLLRQVATGTTWTVTVALGLFNGLHHSTGATMGVHSHGEPRSTKGTSLRSMDINLWQNKQI